MSKTITTPVVRCHRFPTLSESMRARIREGQMESAKVWVVCRDKHQAARKSNSKWPNKVELQKATKGLFALHSQSAQMVCHAFLANIDTTRQRRQAGDSWMRYPHKDKHFYPLLWPAQAMSVSENHIILPMGRGRPSIVLPKPPEFVPGACKLVWNGADYELHVTVEVPSAPVTTATGKATVDLGQIHQMAITTDNGGALIVSGRGMRSLKRRRNMMHREISKLQSRCQRGSRRWKKLQHTRRKYAARSERQERDLAHKGTRAAIDFCVAQQVGQVFIGDPHGVRGRRSGRKHNQRMAQWEYGRDKDYLQQKLLRVGITSFTGTERGTSSRCPQCGHRHKPKGRVWRCKECGFTGHRDLVGSVNMHQDNFVSLTSFPSLKDVTYLRPGHRSYAAALRREPRNPESSSRPDTGHEVKVSCCLIEPEVDTTCCTAPGSRKRLATASGIR